MEESAYTKDRRMETIKSSLTVTEGGANTEEKPAPTAIWQSAIGMKWTNLLKRKQIVIKTWYPTGKRGKRVFKEIRLPKSFTDQSDESAKLSCVAFPDLHSTMSIS